MTGQPSFAARRARLRERVASGATLAAPGATDALSARLIAAAGADMVFPTLVTPGQLAEVRRRVAKPAMIVDMPGKTLADEERAGASIVLYYGFAALVQFDALGRALERFKATRDANAVPGYRDRVKDFEEFLGYQEFAERARTYGTPLAS